MQAHEVVPAENCAAQANKNRESGALSAGVLGRSICVKTGLGG